MTSYTAANRLLKELNAHQRKIRLGCSHDSQLVILQPQSDQDLFHWNATIYGRSNTPYAGGQFELEILVPKDYPTDPPRIRFITTICHPNIHIKTGEICLDLLDKAWSPAWTLESTCMAILDLLSNPEADSPLNCDAANLIRSGDHRGYNSLVQMYTALHACISDSQCSRQQ